MFKIFKLITKKFAAKKPCKMCRTNEDGSHQTMCFNCEPFGEVDAQFHRGEIEVLISRNDETSFGVIIPVNYCPFCGRKYEKGAVKNA